MSAALKGGFLTIGPPGKSLVLCFLVNRLYSGLLPSVPLCGHVSELVADLGVEVRL